MCVLVNLRLFQTVPGLKGKQWQPKAYTGSVKACVSMTTQRWWRRVRMLPQSGLCLFSTPGLPPRHVSGSTAGGSFCRLWLIWTTAWRNTIRGGHPNIRNNLLLKSQGMTHYGHEHDLTWTTQIFLKLQELV